MASTYEDLVSQSHRLLRMKWNNPSDLAQELYSMLMPSISSDIPAEAGDAEDQPPAFTEVQRRLEQAQQFFSNIDQSATVNNTKMTINPPLALETATPTPTPAPSPAPSRSEQSLARIDVNPQPLPSMPFLTIPAAIPAPFIPAPPVIPSPFTLAPLAPRQDLSYSRPDLPIPDPGDLDWSVPINPVKPFQIDEGTGGGILGKVLSKGDKGYLVDLYENGKNSKVTQSGVLVFIPQIDEDDEIPKDTWIAPVIQVTADDGTSESYYQPPIWLT